MQNRNLVAGLKPRCRVFGYSMKQDQTWKEPDRG
jgi:hypothetical protein